MDKVMTYQEAMAELQHLDRSGTIAMSILGAVIITFVLSYVHDQGYSDSRNVWRWVISPYTEWIHEKIRLAKAKTNAQALTVGNTLSARMEPHYGVSQDVVEAMRSYVGEFQVDDARYTSEVGVRGEEFTSDTISLDDSRPPVSAAIAPRELASETVPGRYVSCTALHLMDIHRRVGLTLWLDRIDTLTNNADGTVLVCMKDGERIICRIPGGEHSSVALNVRSENQDGPVVVRSKRRYKKVLVEG
jgi:hypothetical protein